METNQQQLPNCITSEDRDYLASLLREICNLPSGLRERSLTSFVRRYCTNPAVVELARETLARRHSLAVAAFEAILNPPTPAPTYSLPTLPTPLINTDVSDQPMITDVCVDALTTIPIDAEANRILIALGKGAQARVYWFAHEMARRADGAGWVWETDLVTALLAGGVESTAFTIRHRWIKGGEGTLWRRDGKGRLYLVSYKRKLAALLQEWVIEAGKPALISTNPIGAKFILTPVAGSLKQWHGNSLAAWHNSRGDHTKNICRQTLRALWGVTTKTLIAWEKAAGIEVTGGYANITKDDQIPEHAYPIAVVARTAGGSRAVRVRARARVSNIYQPPAMREIQHIMTPRKARRLALELADAVDSSPGRVCGAPDELRNERDGAGIMPTGRRTFYADSKPITEAFKRLHRHLRSQPDDQASHYVALGYSDRYRAWLYEQSSTGFQMTAVNDRLPRALEDAYFASHGGRAQYTVAWRGV